MNVRFENRKADQIFEKHFKNGIQMFNTPSIMGDYRISIYEADDIRVLFAPKYEYIEIYGISEEEFERVIRETGGY